ncbi:pantetheine-phosphate adenylyltransferase [soil metagenome]
MTRALYPGTFDPIHNGHIDIAERASAIFAEVIFAVYDAPPKKLLFSTEERLDLARTALAHLTNVTVTTYTGLTVEYARQNAADVIVRGLRNVADFQYEHQIGGANRQLAGDIELCCFFCNGDYAYLSATILKEVASLGGDTTLWAPDGVQQALRNKFDLAETNLNTRSVSRKRTKLTHRG